MKQVYIVMSYLWLSGVAVFAYWQWFDDPVIYSNEEFAVEAPVHVGDRVLFLHSKFCQSYHAIPASASRIIRNEFVHFITDITLVTAPGCYDVHREIPLPANLMAGPHFYQFTAQFRINPIKVKFGSIKPVPFEVLPK